MYIRQGLWCWLWKGVWASGSVWNNQTYNLHGCTIWICYGQQYDVDCEEGFAPKVRFETVKTYYLHDMLWKG